MKIKALTCTAVLLMALAPGLDAKTKYGIKARADERASFAALRTYVWRPGWTAFKHEIDDALVAAIDRELARVGLARRSSEPADVLVTYVAIQRTDVNVKGRVLADALSRPEYPVGTLLVVIKQPGTGRELFWVRADTRLPTDPTRIGAAIDELVPRMFEEYPEHQSAQH